MYRDSAQAQPRGLQRVSRHRCVDTGKQIILLLTHGHRKVAVFFIWQTDTFPGNPERYKLPGLRTFCDTNHSTSLAPGIRHGDA